MLEAVLTPLSEELEISHEMPILREGIGAELANNESLKLVCREVDKSYLSVGDAKTPKEKVEAFRNSPLGKFDNDMQNEGSRFTAEERTMITEINELIADNEPLFTFLFGAEGWPGVLIDAESNLLSSSNVDQPQIETEIDHYQGVEKIFAQLFPKNILGRLSALVHDTQKFNASGVMELGLHEKAGAISGSELGFQALKLAVDLKLINLSENQLALAKKSMARAIFSHGNGEFPEQVSSINPIEGTKDAFVLFDSQIHIKSEIRSTPSQDDEQRIDSLQEMTTGLNIADMCIGNHPGSLKKYNLSYGSEVVASHESFANFVSSKLYSSFFGNFNNPATAYLQNHGDGETVERFDAFEKKYSNAGAALLLGLGASLEGIISRDKIDEDDVMEKLKSNVDHYGFREKLEKLFIDLKTKVSVDSNIDLIQKEMNIKEKRKKLNDFLGEYIDTINRTFLE